MICGRSPFATFLDMNNWETTVIGSSEINNTTPNPIQKTNLTQAP
jgi:hypothetical protein